MERSFSCNRAMGDGLITTSTGAATLSINNLVHGGKYDLYLYCQSGSNDNEDTTFTFGGTSHEAVNTGFAAIPPATNPEDLAFVLNNNYVKFSVLTADGNGVISGPTMVGNGGGALARATVSNWY